MTPSWTLHRRKLGILVVAAMAAIVSIAIVVAADTPIVLNIGSNGSIGLELARPYAGRDGIIIAACRNPEQAEELQAIAATKNRCSFHQPCGSERSKKDQ